MISNDGDNENELKELEKELQSYPYTYIQKFIKWAQFLSNHHESQNYLMYLTKFLQLYPFNRKYWLEFIALKGPQSYQTALSHNPKCFELWEGYLQHIQLKINTNPNQKNNNTNFLKKQIEKAITEIGADVNAGKIYKLYYPLLSQNVQYEFYKKIFRRCLLDLEDFYIMFKKWLDELTLDQLKATLTKENKGRAPLNHIDTQESKNYLEQQIAKVYNSTLQYRQERKLFEGKIKWYYFEDVYFHKNTPTTQEIQQNYSNWQQLIQLQRKLSMAQNLSYAYERSIIAHPELLDVWEQTFYYLENQSGKYPKVLSILRNNPRFFLTYPRKELYFYWCDLEERQNANTTRNMYIQLQNYYINDTGYNIRSKHSQLIEIYLRHIQFEIRQKKWNDAKNIFDTMLTVYADNIDLLSYIIVEYVNFITKYYKDYEYPKKLIKMYFDYLPYNHYLFVNYLEFMRNYQNKQGYYDELMAVIIAGLTKAKKTLLDVEYTKVVKIVKYHLRNVLSSIYLIKISERKVIEIQGKD